MIINIDWTEYKKNLLYNNKYYYNDILLPAEIELNIASSCTRKCIFCPSAYEKNENENMSLEIFNKIIDQLVEINYKGSIEFCGSSEPFINSNIIEFLIIITKNLPNCKINIITNGDLLNVEILKKIEKINIDHLVISLYDNEQQYQYFYDMFKNSNIKVILRKRFEGFKTNNRAGYFNKNGSKNNCCYYPFYFLIIDITGDVRVCPHDFLKKMIIGNININNLIDIWIKNPLRNKMLKNNRQNISPCKYCDVDGTIIGNNYYLDYSWRLKIEKTKNTKK